MAFTLSFISVDGYLTGFVKSAETLSDATIGSAPSESTTGMSQYNFRRDGAIESGGEWAAYYQPALNQAGDLGDINDFYNYLHDGGYDINNPLVVCAFNLQYNGNPTGKQICLMARDAGNGTFNSYVAVRVKSGNAWVYTTISNDYPLNNFRITRFGMVAGIVTVGGQRWFSLGFAHCYYDYYVQAVLWGNTEAGLETAVGGVPSEEEADENFGPASEPEGYTGWNFDDHSDLIDLPTKPQSVLALGFVNVYKCEANSLTQLGAALFPEIQWPQSLSDVGEVLAALSDSIWNSKLIDYVISIHVVPGNVPAGNLEDIKVGARTMTGILARKISDEYVDVDFGSIETPQLFKNFADYMVQCELYLPFYGFITLKPEEWNGGKIGVKYRFNVIDGSFTAFVFASSNKSKLTDTLIGQYGGSCCVHLPVSNISYASMFSGLIGGAASAAMGAATGGAAAVSGALAGTNAVMNAAAGADGKKSNSYNSSASFMTRRKPYLIISAPVPSFSARYATENGLPSNVTYLIGACRGFTQAEDIILDGIPCTQAEKEKIRALFKNGVIIK